jgi:hypothetical protein
LAVNAQTSTTAEGLSIWIWHRWGWNSPYRAYAGTRLTQQEYLSIPLGAR